jgi:plastocyanin domain-containing protein
MKTDEKSFSYTKLITPLLVLIGILLYLLIKVSGNTQRNLVNQQINATLNELGTVQYLDMNARGGYFPSNLVAKANMATILRIKTSNTFDCSSSITIPGINYRNNLPPTGITEITIPPQSQDTILRGSCSMGMYRFSINFVK